MNVYRTAGDSFDHFMRLHARIVRACAEEGDPKHLATLKYPLLAAETPGEELNTKGPFDSAYTQLGGKLARWAYVICGAVANDDVDHPDNGTLRLLIGDSLHGSLGGRSTAQAPLSAPFRLALVPPRQIWGVRVCHVAARVTGRSTAGPGFVRIYGWSLDWDAIMPEPAP